MQKVRGWKGNSLSKENDFQRRGQSEYIREEKNRKVVAGAGSWGRGGRMDKKAAGVSVSHLFLSSQWVS